MHETLSVLHRVNATFVRLAAVRRSPETSCRGVLAGSPASLLSALDWNKLTDSELTVVHLIAEGATIRSVLEQLHRSPHTVKAHIHNAFANLASRFGLNSRNSCAVRIN